MGSTPTYQYLSTQAASTSKSGYTAGSNQPTSNFLQLHLVPEGMSLFFVNAQTYYYGNECCLLNIKSYIFLCFVTESVGCI